MSSSIDRRDRGPAAAAPVTAGPDTRGGRLWTARRSRPFRMLAVVAAVAAGAALAAGGRAVAQQQDFSKVEIDAVQVRGNVYMLVGAGGNTTIQFGDEG